MDRARLVAEVDDASCCNMPLVGLHQLHSASLVTHFPPLILENALHLFLCRAIASADWFMSNEEVAARFFSRGAILCCEHHFTPAPSRCRRFKSRPRACTSRRDLHTVSINRTRASPDLHTVVLLDDCRALTTYKAKSVSAKKGAAFCRFGSREKIWQLIRSTNAPVCIMYNRI